MRADPLVGLVIPVSTFSSVDLPVPFLPRMTKASPGEIDADTGARRTACPTETVTSFNSITCSFSQRYSRKSVLARGSPGEEQLRRRLIWPSLPRERPRNLATEGCDRGSDGRREDEDEAACGDERERRERYDGEAQSELCRNDDAADHGCRCAQDGRGDGVDDCFPDRREDDG